MNSIIYELIIFDWDGTAVPDRHAPIGALKAALEQLLGEGALCAIVTGTNLDNILKQGVDDLSSLAKLGLHVCTNRGSEV
jgi:hydroxymethylpyrimidine pyrophosphatase-like HAD family hydrolase